MGYWQIGIFIATIIITLILGTLIKYRIINQRYKLSFAIAIPILIIRSLITHIPQSFKNKKGNIIIKLWYSIKLFIIGFRFIPTMVGCVANYYKESEYEKSKQKSLENNNYITIYNLLYKEFYREITTSEKELHKFGVV